MSLGKLGRVDEKFEETLSRIRKKFQNIGIDRVTDRQASKVVADIFENLDFNISRKTKKRNDKFEIEL